MKKETLLKNPNKLVQFFYGTLSEIEQEQVEKVIHSDNDLQSFANDLFSFFILKDRTEDEAYNDVHRMNEAKNRFLIKKK